MSLAPFDSAPLEEIRLESAPLVRVIAQLRYPQLASMADGTVAHAFAKEVSDAYPLFEEAREVSLLIAGTGTTIGQQEQMTNPVWRLQTSDGGWVVTLGRNSLSLESVAYAGRRDFCDRLVRLANTFFDKATPPRFDRFGIRYINRVTDAATIASLPTQVQPEMMGAAALNLPDDVTLHHSLTEAQFNQGAYSMLVRCGVLPAGTTIDLSVPPTNMLSWILDIDSAVTGADSVAVDKINDLAVDLAERAYRFFRYAVNRDFLRIFETAR